MVSGLKLCLCAQYVIGTSCHDVRMQWSQSLRLDFQERIKRSLLYQNVIRRELRRFLADPADFLAPRGKYVHNSSVGTVHQLIMGPRPDDVPKDWVIDHIDRCKLNNCRK